MFTISCSKHFIQIAVIWSQCWTVNQIITTLVFLRTKHCFCVSRSVQENQLQTNVLHMFVLSEIEYNQLSLHWVPLTSSKEMQRELHRVTILFNISVIFLTLDAKKSVHKKWEGPSVTFKASSRTRTVNHLPITTMRITNKPNYSH